MDWKGQELCQTLRDVERHRFPHRPQILGAVSHRNHARPGGDRSAVREELHVGWRHLHVGVGRRPTQRSHSVPMGFHSRVPRLVLGTLLQGGDAGHAANGGVLECRRAFVEQNNGCGDLREALQSQQAILRRLWAAGQNSNHGLLGRGADGYLQDDELHMRRIRAKREGQTNLCGMAGCGQSGSTRKAVREGLPFFRRAEVPRLAHGFANVRAPSQRINERDQEVAEKAQQPARD
mmetsp:Transcript_73666/g.204829  ORF Transcript_73666/g.204829 Transcript_73666/m.204829 type:complete len:235 (+) Transcript_73666:476-1180(+)